MGFHTLDLSEQLLATLETMNFTKPTEIQKQSIPIILEGRDIIAQAQTGTGKTASFILPMLEKIESQGVTQALILAPTRELVLQIEESFHLFAQGQNIRSLAVFGGVSIDRQIRELNRGVDVVIGTPGRIRDLLNRRKLKLQSCNFVTLDEVDEMLNIGFLEEVREILKSVPSQSRQMLFFSATMPKKVQMVANEFLRDPAHVSIAPKELVVDKIQQSFYVVKDSEKNILLQNIIITHNPTQMIIFANTKRRVDEIMEFLFSQGVDVDRIHGDLTQEQRSMTFKRFRAKKLRVLVATDVAARGIDINDINLVVNYDLPLEEEYFVHRIGRTGRAGKQGEATSFVKPRELKTTFRQLQNYIKVDIPEKEKPTLRKVEKALKQIGYEKLLEALMVEKTEETETELHKDYVRKAERLLEEYAPLEIVVKALELLSPEMKELKSTSQLTKEDFNDGGRRSYGRNNRQGGGGRRKDNYQGNRRRDNREGGGRRDDRQGSGSRRDNRNTNSKPKKSYGKDYKG